MQITINFQAVEDGLPPTEQDPYYGEDYSIECIAIVDGEVFDRSVKYCFSGLGGWVWADMAVGYKPADYTDELGGNTPKVTHWAPWPLIKETAIAS